MSERGSEEPSMEEILASIRRIISEDAGAPGAYGGSPAEERKDEVLELTDVLQEDGSVKRLENEPPGAAADAAPDEAAVPAASAAAHEGGLISAAATASSTRALSELASAVAREEVSQGVDVPLGTSSHTLAEIVTELLRPMMREWLDQNLPGLIERLVRKEIEKLVRRAQDR